MWLVCCLVQLLSGWVGLLTGSLSDWVCDRLGNWEAGRLNGPVAGRLPGRLFGLLGRKDWLAGWVAGWLADRAAGRDSGWLVGRSWAVLDCLTC